MKTLGLIIKENRVDNNLNEKELAEILGVDEFSILNWESDKTNPNNKIRYKFVPIQYKNINLLAKFINFFVYRMISLFLCKLGNFFVYRTRSLSEKTMLINHD